MLEALAWGLLAASSLLIGAAVALRVTPSKRLLGLVMAFAVGVLISAVAYELFLSAVREYDALGAAAGLFAGSLVFFGGDAVISRMDGSGRKSAQGVAQGASGLAITLGTVLDGIPESAVLGLSLIEGSVALTMLVAVFLSNFPEALAATAGLRKGGWSVPRVLLLWLVVIAVSGLASALGFAVFDDSPDAVIAFVLAFAAGAILTMLADTMVPEAFDDSGPLAGVITTLGFAVAVAVQALE